MMTMRFSLPIRIDMCNINNENNSNSSNDYNNHKKKKKNEKFISTKNDEKTRKNSMKALYYPFPTT